jgi:hypothetical protein
MATVRLSVPENSDAGTLIGVPITPSDFDRDQTYTYSMTGGGSSFEIVPETGQIQVKNTAVLNYEGPQNTFTVVAESSDSGTPPQKSTIVIEIKITDVNESPSLPNGIVIEAREDAEMGGSIGEPLSIYAVDPDEGSKISFSKNFLDVAIRAEGCDDAGKRGGCGTTTINIGGKDQSQRNRGHNVVVLDQSSGDVLESESFDTYGSAQQGKDLARFIENVQDGRVVVVATQDSANTHSKYANDALKGIGAGAVTLKRRDTFAVVGMRGIFGPLNSGSFRRIFVDGGLVADVTDPKSISEKRQCLAAVQGTPGIAGVVLKECTLSSDIESGDNDIMLWSQQNGQLMNAGTGYCVDVETFKNKYGRTTDDAKQTCLDQISGTDDAAKTARAACEATALSTASPQYPLQQGDRLVQRPCEDAADTMWHETENGQIQSTWTDFKWAAKKTNVHGRTRH